MLSATHGYCTQYQRAALNMSRELAWDRGAIETFNRNVNFTPRFGRDRSFIISLAAAAANRRHRRMLGNSHIWGRSFSFENCLTLMVESAKGPARVRSKAQHAAFVSSNAVIAG
jgi:hypothetical protein